MIRKEISKEVFLRKEARPSFVLDGGPGHEGKSGGLPVEAAI